MSKEFERLINLGEDARPTADEVALLDACLSDESTKGVRRWVRSLPEDEPSLAWRSGLNERLLAQRPAARRPWFLHPAWSVAAAGVLAVVFWATRMQPVQGTASGVSLEAALVSTHRDSVRASEIAGVGMAPHDLATLHKPAPAAARFDWNEMDMETL